MPTRRAALALPLLLPAHAAAQGWPSQPIRLIVPFGASGATDVFARMMAERISGPLGQRVFVENRPGAGATIGAQQAARAAPDGHTLLMVTSSHTIGESLMPSRGYRLLQDFVPVAAFNNSALAVSATPSLPVADMAGLIAHARARPGALSYATTGNGTVNHLAGELIRLQAGLDWVHVPYRAGAEARADLMAGRVPIMLDPITNAAELARDGRVKVLAVTSAARSSAMPKVPPMAATLPGFDVGLLIGLVAPVGTPEMIVARLNAEIRAVIAMPEVVRLWRAQGAEPIDATAAEWGAMLAADTARWVRVVREAGLRVEG
jgi:tripartite-type tricarboxylate transporter receptor subunit TctC